MKRLILIGLIFAAMISLAANRTGTINAGSTVLSKTMSFSTSDSVITSATYTITITAFSQFPCKQNFYTTISTVSGSPSIAVSAYGKCFSGDAWVQIGSTQTWTSSSNNPVNISATTPNQYNYYKVAYVASGATQQVKITAFDMKLWYTSGLASSGTLTDGTATINSGAITGATTIAASGRITGTGGATITGAATNINASSNFATNIGTGTTDAAISIGGGSNTVAVNSSAWDISTAGVCTSFGTINGYTIANGVGGLVTTATADADSTVTASKLTAVNQFVTVTSGGATRIITLPALSASTVGMVIRGYVGGNGFELRVATADAAKGKINDVTTHVEAAIPATTFFTVQCVSATQWILTCTTKYGVVLTAIVPDAI